MLSHEREKQTVNPYKTIRLLITTNHTNTFWCNFRKGNGKYQQALGLPVELSTDPPSRETLGGECILGCPQIGTCRQRLYEIFTNILSHSGLVKS